MNRIFVDNVPADKLRDALQEYDPKHILAIVVSRYQDGWAVSYQIIYSK